MDLRRVEAFVAKAHEGQIRKGLHHPYIVHPFRVAAAARAEGMDEDAIAAALGHDVVEDTRWTFAELEDADLFTPRALALIRLLTKWWTDDAPLDVKARHKPLYYGMILEDPIARDLKLLDRTDNLEDMARLWQMSGATKSEKKWVVKFLAKTQREFVPFETVGSPWALARYHRALADLIALTTVVPAGGTLVGA